MQEKIKEMMNRIIAHFGHSAQKIKAIEELNELVVELAKDLNGKLDKSALIDELADARIMLSQLFEIYRDYEQEITTRINFKLDRTLRYINEHPKEEDDIWC